MAIFILGRIIFGAYFVYSGFKHFRDEKMLTDYSKSKGVPSPRLAVLGAGVLMIAGGLGFLFDYDLDISAVLLLIFLIPTTLIVHAFWKIKDPAHRMSEETNFLKNMALIGALLMML